MSRKAKDFTTMIFDLDGTLVDSLRDIADAANKTLESMNFPVHPVDAYRQFVGDGLLVLAQRIVPEHTEEDKISEIVNLFKVHYDRNWDLHTRPYPGIDEMLRKVTDSGLNTAVLSNKPDAFTRQIAAHYFPQGLFTQVVGAREGAPHKPDPGAALGIAETLGLPPERILYLGDTNTDMQTGRRAGMFTVGALWGFRTREELLENGAQALVETPGEVLGWFGG